MKTFRELCKLDEVYDSSSIKKLRSMKTVKTKAITASSWYSPSTEYEVVSVDDGHYSHKPGVYTIGDKFIPINDLLIDVNEAFTQTTAPKLIDKYLDKVKPEEAKDKGQVRFDIEDGFYIKFSAVGERNDKEHTLLGYRIEIDSRRLELGTGDTIFTDWKTIYSTYYNIETKKFGDSFSKLFHTDKAKEK